MTHVVSVTEAYAGISPFDYSQQPNDDSVVEGLRVTITPPVSLCADAVKNYIGNGSFDGRNGDAQTLSHAILIGTNEEAETTIIFAGIPHTRRSDSFGAARLEKASQTASERTIKLLSYLGIYAVPGMGEHELR